MGKAAKFIATLALCATLVLVSPLSSNARIVKNTLLTKSGTTRSTLSTSIKLGNLTTIPNNKMPLYVFGDSLYDTGMGMYGLGPKADISPYGETYFKRPAGRFSDGRLIPDFIADFANLSFPEPYLKPGFDNYLESVNFADAAAGVLVDTRPNTYNLKLQVDFFLEMVQKLEQKYGKEQTRKLLSRAVYLFNIGANDYVDLYNLNKKPLSTSLKSLRVSQVLGNLTTHFTTIYNKGGRKFAYHNSAPMGCLPAFLLSNGSCAEELNEMARAHNDGFKAMAKNLTRQLPGFKYSIYDFYKSLSARLKAGTNYGFNESQSACCGSGPFNGRFTCGQTGKYSLCSDPNQYLWFDAAHPTEIADQQFAEEFWGGFLDVVRPRNIRSFFPGH